MQFLRDIYPFFPEKYLCEKARQFVLFAFLSPSLPLLLSFFFLSRSFLLSLEPLSASPPFSFLFLLVWDL